MMIKLVFIYNRYIGENIRLIKYDLINCLNQKGLLGLLCLVSAVKLMVPVGVLSVLAPFLHLTAFTLSFRYFLFGKLAMSSMMISGVAMNGAKLKSVAQI